MIRPTRDHDLPRSADHERRGPDREPLATAAQRVRDGNGILGLLDPDPARQPRQLEPRAVTEHLAGLDRAPVDGDRVAAEHDQLDAVLGEAEERVAAARGLGGELEIAAAVAADQHAGRAEPDCRM